MPYSVIIQYDRIDQIYVASIPELQGCMAHGKTPEDAMREVAIARDLWIETAHEVGRSVPEPTYYAATVG